VQVSIEHKPSYALAVCKLAAGEAVRAESGAMMSMSSNVRVQTASGGVGAGLKRMFLGGESFFQNTFTAEGAPGEVTFAPTLPGDIVRLPIAGDLVIAKTGYLASSPAVAIDTKFQGMRGLFSGRGLFMLKASGTGDILLSAFGAIHEVAMDGEYIVDTGHLVAFESTLEYSVRRVGGWFATIFSGEGLVTRFRGRGRLWIQTRNPRAFGQAVGRKLPPRSN
jgi:uncharacterized protein (TIGR00266 family)